MVSASPIEVAAGLPVRLALETASRSRQEARGNNPVIRHAHGDGSSRLTQIPRQRWLRRQHNCESTGPEPLDERVNGRGNLGDQCSQRGGARNKDRWR